MTTPMMSQANGVPWWVKATATLGFPIVVAAFLLAQTAGWVPSVAVDMSRDLSRHAEDQATRAEGLALALDRREAKVDELLRRLTVTLRVMCENGARSDAERRNCGNIQ